MYTYVYISTQCFLSLSKIMYFSSVSFLFLDKIDKLEIMLYKTLKAMGHLQKDGKESVCLQNHEEHCLNDEDIYCAHIDLLANSSDCQTCVQGGWEAMKSCYLQFEKGKFNISGESVYIDVDGNYVNGTITDNSHAINVSDDNCYCVSSKYNYTKIGNETELTSDENNQLLFCECKNQDQKGFRDNHYCLKGDKNINGGKKRSDEVVNSNNVAVCYEKSGICKVSDDGNKVSCTTKQYSQPPDEEPYPIITDKSCQPLKSLSCEIIAISVSDENIKFTKDGHEWKNAKAKVKCSNAAGPCTVDFNKMCETINTDHICKKVNEPPITNDADSQEHNPDGTSSSDDDSTSSAPFLIIIIIILVVLLLSYCGYQNQWHHKVSMLPVHYHNIHTT